MKKIAFITNGTLPIPSIEGGAIEDLVTRYLNYNDATKKILDYNLHYNNR